MKTLLFSAALCSVLAVRAEAQSLPQLYVTDTANDQVFFLIDFMNNGNYDDPGEISAFYSDTIGALALGNNAGLRSGPDDWVFVSDSTEDSIFAFRDFNGELDADDEGEHVRWFDGRAGGNASGILMPAANGLIRDPATNVWWVACANAGGVGVDSVLRLVDLNADFDANDAGEASEYWTAPGSPGGDSVPQAVTLGPDGALYLCDAPSSGPNGKGIYRLVDLTADGDAQDPGESAPFFIPPAAATPFFWCVEVDAQGWFYTADTGNELVWRFKDLNGNNHANDPGEANVFWTIGAPSNIWDLAVAPDGSLYASDSEGASRIVRLRDANFNGTIEAGEVSVVYDATSAALAIGNGRGIDLRGAPAAGNGFCFGDGTATACPCGNFGTPGKGCANSVNPNGARLEPQGVASVANDSLRLIGTRMPNSSALYLQGTANVALGQGTVFGDGLRCAAGTVMRLGTQLNVAGTSHYPEPGDASVSVRGFVAVGDTRYYQVWYRNADPLFCPSAGFNLSNGLVITWGL